MPTTQALELSQFSKLVNVDAQGNITLLESGVQYPIVTQQDIGTAPNEVPLNQYLGNLAYQNSGAIAGNVFVGGNLSVIGNTTLGDEANDTLTINALNVSIPNNLNFAANTLFIDSINSRVGIGTNTPLSQSTFHVVSTRTTPLIVESENFEGNVAFQIRNMAAASSLNFASFALIGRTSSNVRTAGNFNASFIDTNDSTRTSSFNFSTASNGVFGINMSIIGNQVGIGTSSPSSKLAVNGSITESTDSTNYYPVVTQEDIGTAPNEVPLNQYLGSMAYQGKDQVVLNPVASAVPSGIGDMVFQLTSDTSLEIKVKGSDGTVRSVALTLA